MRIICPIAAGGGIDATARIVAAQLSEIWGERVVVENKTGASGNIGAEYVAHARPDGYTIYIATFPHATNRWLYASLAYDPVADFAPVTLIGLYPLMMVVPNSSPAHSIKDSSPTPDAQTQLRVVRQRLLAASRRRLFSAAPASR